MGSIKKFIRQVSSLGADQVQASETQREFQFHIDMETQRLIQLGLPAEEARRRALVAFGGEDRYEEEMRDGWPRRALLDFKSDVRFALRALRGTPIFTITAVATLAIGLGGVAAVFTMVNKVLLAPLPYADEDRIVRIFQQNSQTNRWSLSVADMNGIEQWQRSFASFAAIRTGEMALSGNTEPTWVRAGRATQGLFTTLGIGVASGRVYLPSDAAPDAPPVAVITDAIAREHFGGASAVGRTIVLDRVTYTVIGVLAPGVTGLGGVSAEVWPLLRLETPTRRGPFGLVGLARLKPGVTLEMATADLSNVSDQLFPIYASNFSDKSAKLTPFPLREVMFGDATKSLAVLLGAVALVLLIALANVTNLVLVRATGRRREIALRVALGAGRMRLSRLLLTENIVLSMFGGLLAIGVAAAALRMLKAIGPTLPRMDTAQLDLQTIGFIILVSIACGVVIALYPMAFSTARGVAQALRSGDRRASAGRGTRVFQDGLVVTEFALALPLFAGAALLLHSFVSLQRVDTGIDPTNTISIRVTLPATQYPDTVRGQFWQQTLGEVSGVPGVMSAAVASSLPPDNFGDTNNFDLIDKPVPTGTAEPVSPWSSVSPGFFKALRVPLISGRTFDDRDHGDAPPVLVVSRTWAERYFPGESPIGKQLIEGGCTECPRSTVVGIVGDTKYSGLAGSGEGVYVPYEQWPRPSVFLVVRTQGDPHALLQQIRARVHAVDAGLPLVDTELMTDRLNEAVAEPRHWTLLVGGFAALAVLLAALGVFGVMSYIVSQQQREIGVRLALGATPRSVITLILRRGLTLAGIGTVVGVIAALQGTRMLEHVLFGVSATDPTTLGVVAVALIGIATLACYLPGRRAAAVDPVRVMAAE